MNRHERLFACCSQPRRRDQPNNLSSESKEHAWYGREFSECYKPYLKSPLTVAFGDHTSRLKEPTLVKTRCVGDANGVLLPLNRKRHWVYGPHEIALMDIAWESKTPTMVWRGTSTGKCRAEKFDAHPRTQLVRRWFGHKDQGIDVAYSEIVQNKESECGPYVGGKLSMEVQLQHAFILSVEGNDVASNLKWILASNSVPIMPPPRYESWLLESRLVPMRHYVPVSPDWSDLDKVLDWCRTHLTECKRIAMEGKTYIEPFFDIKAERALEWAVLDRYLGRRLFGLDGEPPAPKPNPKPVQPPPIIHKKETKSTVGCKVAPPKSQIGRKPPTVRLGRRGGKLLSSKMIK